MLRIATALLVCALAFAAFTTTARASSFDPSFGANGLVFFGHGGGTEYGPAVGDRVGQARALALDDQGRILVGGGSGAAMLLLRYLPNGTLDASFGSHGAVRWYEYQTTGSKSEDPDFSAPRIKEVIPQASGKIIVIAQTFAVGFVGGAQRDVVFWLNEDGTLDASNGIPFSERVGELLGSMPRAAAVGPDGSIYMVGQAIVGSDDFGTSRKYAGYIMKRTTLGYPAPSFGLNFSPGGGEPRPGIRIWNPKGSPPQSAVSSFKILKSGKVLVGGHVNNRMFVSRLNSHGKLDRSFGPWRGKGKRNRGMTIVNFGGTNPVGRTLQTRRIPFATPKQSLLAELGHDRPESPLGLFKPNGTIAQRSPRLRIELLEQVLNNGAQVR